MTGDHTTGTWIDRIAKISWPEVQDSGHARPHNGAGKSSLSMLGKVSSLTSFVDQISCHLTSGSASSQINQHDEPDSEAKMDHASHKV